MNVIYYLLGGFLTLIGIITYRFFQNGSYVINQSNLVDLLATAIIAGIAFFVADYLMSKKG